MLTRLLFGDDGGSSSSQSKTAENRHGGKPAKTQPKKRRLLTCTLVEARGILPINRNNTSDSYVKATLLDVGGRPIKKEEFKTEIKSKTLSPRYDTSFEFGKTYNLNTDHLPSLQLSMYHYSTFSVSETPLGVVIVNLDIVEPSGGTELDLWFPLDICGRMKTVSGEVRLRLVFSDPMTKVNRQSVRLAAELHTAQADVDIENPDTEEMQPNELHIVAIRARGLQAVDWSLLSASSSDPFVEFEIIGEAGKEFEKKKTKVVYSCLEPVWNETFIWPRFHDNINTIQVSVFDSNNIASRALLGSILIPASLLADRKIHKKWYKLLEGRGVSDGQERGEIELAMVWKFNANILNEERLEKAAAKGGGSSFFGGGGGGGGEDDSDYESGVDAEDEEKEKQASPETDAEKEKKAKDDEEKQAALREIMVQSGDYQIQVHIIEARDLKPENFDGTSDPVVYVECFGETRHTRVIPSCTSCVFDELMIFNFSALNKEQVMEGVVRISVFDYGLAKNTMIGSYAVDAVGVYTSSKSHELYRQWVPLMDDVDPGDIGVQGYLKLSVQIIGPGERVVLHDEDAEQEEELKREAAVGGDVGSLIVDTPTVRKEWQYVVVSVYKCEDLPIMDAKLIGGMIDTAGTDAFCKLSVAGGKESMTKVKTVKSDQRMAIQPVFDCEMWYPVAMPTMSNLIKLSVWDNNKLSGARVIGNLVQRIAVIQNAENRELPPRWYNLYGSQELGNQETVLAQVSEVAASIKKTFSHLGGGPDWFNYYNAVPDSAPCYKGRILLGFRMERKKPHKYDKKSPEVQPFRRPIRGVKSRGGKSPLIKEPITHETFALHAIVFGGTGLPEFTTSANLRVKVSIGLNELCTKEEPLDMGMARWNQHLWSESLRLPQDMEQMPDIFIHLLKGDDRPICFARIKACDVVEGKYRGFASPAQWFQLQKDRALGAVDESQYPGSLLIKLGFGLQDDYDSFSQDWDAALEKAMRNVKYQARVHVYQARNLPTGDSNGLCDPILVCSFMGQKLWTQVRYKTLFPTYYETLVFDNVSIPPGDNDFEFASQIVCRLFDEDCPPLPGVDRPAIADEFVGTFSIPMKDAVVTLDLESTPARDIEPKWYDVYRSMPGDATGQFLMSVQLIPTGGKSLPNRVPDPVPEHLSIVPTSRRAFLELICVGLRNLAPFHFQSIINPYLEISLDSLGSSYVATTKASKVPDPSNPNYLERIVMPVRLPEKSIFASPLVLRVHDTRLGGYLKPVVGVGAIDLSTKIPWCDTFVPPSTTDMYATTTEPETVAGAVAGKENATPLPTSQAPTLSTSEDNGAGVFGGSLSRVEVVVNDGNNTKKVIDSKDQALAFTDPDWTQDDGDQPPAWAVGRIKLVHELEEEFKTTPFETYDITRGKVHGILGATFMVVGKFKGLVRVLLDEHEPSLLDSSLMSALMKPKAYKVRLYCLRAQGLASLNKDIFGRPPQTDPYLRVTLGKFTFDDRENAQNDTSNADMQQVVEINAELPGSSQLKIEIMDKVDVIGRDELLGSTVIDLEDRWFDKRWQAYGEENMIEPGKDKNDSTKVRWRTKPIEQRVLYHGSSAQGQGIFECWLDILRPEEAQVFPCDDVHLPPSKMFEVRIVIWKSLDVPAMDWFEGMSDLYVKCNLEGSIEGWQETDTHWRCSNGNASWNYRLLFDIELGHSTRAMKFPYLYLQLWDRDVVKWSDCAGEHIFDLRPYYRKAFKRNIALKLFEQKQGAAAARAAKAEKQQPVVAETRTDINSSPTPIDVIPPVSDVAGGAGELRAPTTATTAAASTNSTKTQPPASSSQEEVKSQVEVKTTTTTNGYCWGTYEEDEEEKRKAEKNKEEVKGCVDMCKSATGLWDDVPPPDSMWVDFTKKDHNTDVVKHMGKVAFSVQIWPKDKAIAMNVGAARAEPNTNPYLPLPVGRFKFSWNPFVLGTELCGARLCGTFTCCLLCIVFVLLTIFAQPLLNILILLHF